jgi:Flp pilus assembly protein TadG
MILRRGRRPQRGGIAVLELAMTFPFLMTVIVGIWVVGRLIQVQAILSEAVYVGARQAAQGQYVSPTTHAVLKVAASDVKQTVLNYLLAAGLPVPGSANPAKFNVVYTDVTNPAAVDPWQATQADQLSLTATLAYDQFGWTNFGLFGPIGTFGGGYGAPPSTITSSISMISLNDLPINPPPPPPAWAQYVLT